MLYNSIGLFHLITTEVRLDFRFNKVTLESTFPNCESNRVGHCECESNKKTVNCESICELRAKKAEIMSSFLLLSP